MDNAYTLQGVQYRETNLTLRMEEGDFQMLDDMAAKFGPGKRSAVIRAAIGAIYDMPMTELHRRIEQQIARDKRHKSSRLTVKPRRPDCVKCGQTSWHHRPNGNRECIPCRVARDGNRKR